MDFENPIDIPSQDDYSFNQENFSDITFNPIEITFRPTYNVITEENDDKEAKIIRFSSTGKKQKKKIRKFKKYSFSTK